MRKRKYTIAVVLLSPLTILYRMVIGVRNAFFDWDILPIAEFNLPIISVGNITVGGTGKTPHVEYLVELLKDEFSLASLSRGYKRKTRHFLIADMNSTSYTIGDEPRQLKQKYPEMIVAVDRKRVNGITQLLKLPDPLDVILLDDAFQHRYVKAGKSILLMDYERMITEDFLLPSGRLREPISAMKRADIILITKSPERIKPIEMRNIVKNLDINLRQHLFFTSIKYGELKPVFNIDEPQKESYFKENNTEILLLTGIANPRHIRKFARSISTHMHELSFPDHHTFDQRDILKIRSKIESIDNNVLILTTEKDAMRLQDLDIDEDLKRILYYVPIQVKFLQDQQEEFNKIILNYVRSNKRNNILHKEANTTTA